MTTSTTPSPVPSSLAPWARLLGVGLVTGCFTVGTACSVRSESEEVEEAREDFEDELEVVLCEVDKTCAGDPDPSCGWFSRQLDNLREEFDELLEGEFAYDLTHIEGYLDCYTDNCDFLPERAEEALDLIRARDCSDPLFDDVVAAFDLVFEDCGSVMFPLCKTCVDLEYEDLALIEGVAEIEVECINSFGEALWWLID